MVNVQALLRQVGVAHRAGVPRSAEFERVWNLPTRELDKLSLVAPWTARLQQESGHRTLFPDQAAALEAISRVGSAIVALRPGAGKTTIGMLGLAVAGCTRPVYICDAAAKDQVVHTDIPTLRSHWKIPGHMTVLSYQELSSKNGRKLFDQIQPDGVVADEAQKLKSESAARTNRFLAYFKARYAAGLRTVFLPMSGSFTIKSLTEMYHLFREALGENSPVPLVLDEAKLWSDALGSAVKDENRVELGALKHFALFLEEHERQEDELSNTRRGFRRRMELSEGVVLSTRGNIHLPLTIRHARPTIPINVEKMFEHLHETWEVGEEELTDRIEFNAAARQLICGFYYRWVWPNNVKNDVWIEARRAWHKYVRNIVLYEKRLQLDSRGLVQDACLNHEAFSYAKREKLPKETLRHFEDKQRLDSPEYRAWRAVENEYRIVTEAVWFDEYLLDIACDWLEKNDGVVWVPFRTIGAKLRERGVKYFGGGENGLTDEKTGPCAASIASHHHSKNLQHWSRCLYLLPPGNGQLAEQSLARFHRTGQTRPVVADMLISCKASLDAWHQSLRDAKYAQDINSDQLLCAADLSATLTEADVLGDESPVWRS